MKNDESQNKICVLLLAGGIGSRMGSLIPKQFLQLDGKPIALYSFDAFASMAEVTEIVIVCAEEYQHLFSPASSTQVITFASPGIRRQDSVYNALKAMRADASLICIHDAARPFATVEMAKLVIASAKESGAATAAVQVKYTLKESDAMGRVIKTPNRTHFWEVQTPQVIQKHLLEKGFAHAAQRNLNVTDDVSLIEQLGHPVQLVQGSYRNLKITTAEDLAIAHVLLSSKP